MNHDFSATIVTTFFATVLASLVNLYAPVPNVVRDFNWVIVALGPFLFMAFAMATDRATDGGDRPDFGPSP